jgi:hypothetical protein
MRPATRRASKVSRPSIFSETPRNLIGRPGDGAHGQGGAAAAVAVGAGQDEAGQGQALVEGLGGAYRVLAGERVGHQQDLGGIGDLRNLGGLVHHRLVERGAPGGVEDEDVVALQLGRGHGAPRDLDRRLAGDDGQAVDAGLRGQQGQLLHGGGTAGVQRGQHDLLALARQAQSELAGGGGLARALQAGHQDHGRRVEREVQPLGLAFAAQHLDQAVVGDLDHLVGGADRADHRLARGLFLGLGDEIADHRQGDVGLEQGDAHLAQGLIDVLLGQHATTAETVEDPR